MTFFSALPAALRLVLAAALLVASAAGAQTSPPVVQAIEVRADEPLRDGSDWHELVAFRPGDLLTEEAVRRTLANFHASGLVGEAAVFQRREAEGVVAVVVLFTPTWVVDVDLEGELGLDRDVLLRRVEQQENTPLSEERLQASVEALRGALRDGGYREAEVSLAVEPAGSPKRLRAVFHVESGPRAAVGELRFTGAIEPWTPAALRDFLRLETGAPFSVRRAAADAERLKTRLVSNGYLQAEVRLTGQEYDAASHRMHLTYDVEAGPHIQVDVVGANRRWLQRRGLLPFLDEQGFDEALLAQTRDKLRSHFQRKGFYQAEVVMDSREVEPGRLHLTVRIDPGPEYSLEKITFRGNEHFPDKELRALMSTSDHRGLQPGSGRLVGEVLREDIDNLVSFYVLQGFPAVEVGPAQINSIDTRLELVVPIREGLRQRVVQLRMPGMATFEADEILEQMALQSGGPFHPVLLDDSVNLLRALYEEEGYAEALVTPSLDWNAEGTLVDVDLKIQEGRRSVVDRVILRGHRRTRPDVVRRTAGLRHGDTISRRRLLEAERNLYRLGIFSRVDVETVPRARPVGLAADAASGERDVVIHLDEGSRWRLSYGLSYHSDDGVGGLLGLSRNNLGGRGDRLQLNLRANANDRRFRLIFDQPSLAGLNIPITYTLFRQDEERESFSVQDLGFQTALTKDLPSLRLGLTYEYREVALLETKVDPQDIDRQDSEVQISSLTPNFFVDRRDDPLEPTRGWTASAQLEYAFPFVEATASFAKLFLQQSVYVPLGRAGVLAASIRLGAIEPLGDDLTPDPLLPPELASARVPMPERFFAGGRTTHRAYERDKLGVPGQTLLDIEGEIFEAGGNGLFLFNLDYRFPIAGAIGGSLFFDVGNVWADWREIHPDGFKPGAGVGLRYVSPIGPVRLEIGWKLDPETRESEKPVFFLSLGNPF